MHEERKTRRELLEELNALRRRVAQLEQGQKASGKSEQALRESEEKYRRKESTLEIVAHSKRSILPNHNKTVDNILEKLKRRAGQLGYGSLLCDIQVHEGRIRQIEVTVVKEKIRAD